MKEATAIDIEGLVKGYLRGTAWHCTFYTPVGRQRRKLATKNKRQAERRAREIADLIQREDWEALSTLDWRPKGQAGTFAIFVRDEFLPKFCNWSERTRKGEKSRLRILCEQFGGLPLSGSLHRPSRRGWRSEMPRDSAPPPRIGIWRHSRASTKRP